MSLSHRGNRLDHADFWWNRQKLDKVIEINNLEHG